MLIIQLFNYHNKVSFFKGPDCKHDTIVVGTLKKDVSARYCSIFPSININGVVRHLQLKPGELKDYQEQCEIILKRYIRRLQWLLSGKFLRIKTRV